MGSNIKSPFCRPKKTDPKVGFTLLLINSIKEREQVREQQVPPEPELQQEEAQPRWCFQQAAAQLPLYPELELEPGLLHQVPGSRW